MFEFAMPGNANLNLDPRCSNVEELLFDDVNLSFYDLTTILLAPKNLKSFSYSEECCRIARELPELLQSLEENFSHSLEVLSINLRSGTVLSSRSLSGFSKLKILECNTPIFAGQSLPLSALLPISIKKLTIHKIYKDFAERYGDATAIRTDLGRSENGLRLLPHLCEVNLGVFDYMEEKR